MLEVREKEYKLRFNINAIADIEQKAGKGIGALFSEENMGVNSIRLLLWGAIRHQEKGLTLDKAGMILDDFMEEGGTLESLMTDYIQPAMEKCKFLQTGEGKSEGK